MSEVNSDGISQTWSISQCHISTFCSIKQDQESLLGQTRPLALLLDYRFTACKRSTLSIDHRDWSRKTSESILPIKTSKDASKAHSLRVLGDEVFSSDGSYPLSFGDIVPFLDKIRFNGDSLSQQTGIHSWSEKAHNKNNYNHKQSYIALSIGPFHTRVWYRAVILLLQVL